MRSQNVVVEIAQGHDRGRAECGVQESLGWNIGHRILSCHTEDRRDAIYGAYSVGLTGCFGVSHGWRRTAGAKGQGSHVVLAAEVDVAAGRDTQVGDCDCA